MQENALYIVQTLAQEGFVAYFAGGWVRDHLLGHPSDDIDIATNALPEDIQRIFPHTVPIGISFGIVLVVLDHHPYEVATFRQDFDYLDARRPSKIAFTDAKEDAKRRDFTINGMFYDPLEKRVLDYVGGKHDLERRILRAIGDPKKRFEEDRLRMIRAARLACRFSLTIEPHTKDAILATAPYLFPAVAIERVHAELSKGHLFGNLPSMLSQLEELHLLSILFPEVDKKHLPQTLAILSKYPPTAPLMAFLYPFLGTLPEETICTRWKLSKEERLTLSFLRKSASLLSEPSLQDDVEWTYYYAHPLSSLALSLHALALSDPTPFHHTHSERQLSLAPHILRVQKKLPVVTASHLLAAGIPPGKQLGEYLRQAEALAIQERLEDPEIVLQKLFDKCPPS